MEKYKNNKFEISGLRRNEEFQLPDGSYSVSDIQEIHNKIIQR